MTKSKKICINDVYRHAIAVEKKGAKLYKALSKIAKDKSIISMFCKMEKIKEEHGAIYQDILDQRSSSAKSAKRRAKAKALREKEEAEAKKQAEEKSKNNDAKKETKQLETKEKEKQQEKEEATRKKEELKTSKKILSEEIKEELIIDKIFCKIKLKEDFSTLKNILHVLNKCISLQKRMIENYESFLDLIDKKHKGLLIKIINEEKKHLTDLLKIKSKNHIHERRSKRRPKVA